jgi:beta-glucosidase
MKSNHLLNVGFPPVSGGVDRPRRLLRGFAKLALAPGESATVRFAVAASDLAHYDEREARWRIEAPREYSVHVGGTSDMAQQLSARFDAVPAFTPAAAARL